MDQFSLDKILYALIFLVSSTILGVLSAELIEMLPKDSSIKLRKNEGYLSSDKYFPLITKHFFEKFNVFCEQLSSSNHKYYNPKKKIYVIILEKFNDHGQTIAIYSAKRIVFSEEKLRNFIQTFALRVEKRVSNQNGTLMIFTRTKKSPYFNWYSPYRTSETRQQQEVFYDLIKDAEISID